MTDQNNMEFSTENTDIATLPPADRALIVLESTKTEEHLKALVVEAAPITEVNSPAGREQAHSLGMKMRKARTTIEKTGKAAREDAQAFSKAVIGEEKRLIGIIEGEEKRVLGLRDGYDAQVEAERAAKAAAEAARVAGIKQKIEGIRGLPLALAGEPSDVIEAELQALTDFQPNEEVFAEFTVDCLAAKLACLTALGELFEKVRAQEDAALQAQAEAAAAQEARRVADEALAAERAAIEEERAALARERAEITRERAERDAAAMQAMDPLKEAIELSDKLVQHALENPPTHFIGLSATNAAPAPAYTAQPAIEFVAPEPATDWKIRQFALATADQFDALAGKVEACGVQSFADDLRLAALSVRNGAFDAALAGADSETLVRFDNALLDSTVNAIDALGGGEVSAAA